MTDRLICMEFYSPRFDFMYVEIFIRERFICLVDIHYFRSFKLNEIYLWQAMITGYNATYFGNATVI